MLTEEQLTKTDACILGAMEVSSSWWDDFSQMRAALTAGYTKTDIKEAAYREALTTIDGTYEGYTDELDFELTGKDVAQAVDHFISNPFDKNTNEFWSNFFRIESVIKEERLPYGYITKYFEEADVATKQAFISNCAEFDYVMNEDVVNAVKDVLLPAMKADPKEWEWLDWLEEDEVLAEKEPTVSKYDFCAPKEKYMTRERVLQAFDEALTTGTDVTGIVSFVDFAITDETLSKENNLEASSREPLLAYIKARITSPTSPVGKRILQNRTGDDVAREIGSIIENQRWR